MHRSELSNELVQGLSAAGGSISSMWVLIKRDYARIVYNCDLEPRLDPDLHLRTSTLPHPCLTHVPPPPVCPSWSVPGVPIPRGLHVQSPRSVKQIHLFIDTLCTDPHASTYLPSSSIAIVRPCRILPCSGPTLLHCRPNGDCAPGC